MKKTTVWAVGALTASLVLGLLGSNAFAQQTKAPPAPAGQPAAQPAPKAAPKAAKAAKSAKKASHCKGLAQAVCSKTAECGWRAEATVKKGKNKGKKIAAHCRKDTPPPKAKKGAAAAPAAGTTAKKK